MLKRNGLKRRSAERLYTKDSLLKSVVLSTMLDVCLHMIAVHTTVAYSRPGLKAMTVQT